VPEDKAQENFTDPDSRIMKRAGGGFDASYNAQTAVDEAAHIVVAAELTNVGSDAAELPKMLAAIKGNLGHAPLQALADTGYRSEAVFERLADGETDIVVSLGREGKQQVKFHHDRNPYSAAMAAKLTTEEAKRAYRKRKWIVEPPNGWIKKRAGIQAVQYAGAAPCASRVEARLHGAELAPNGQHDSDEPIREIPQHCYSPRTRLPKPFNSLGQSPERRCPHPNPLPEGEGAQPFPAGEAARSAGEGVRRRT
jgi:hypothetical protein